MVWREPPPRKGRVQEGSACGVPTEMVWREPPPRKGRVQEGSACGVLTEIVWRELTPLPCRGGAGVGSVT